MLKFINQFIVFLLELVMIGAFAYYGFYEGTSTIGKIVLAFLFVLIVVFLWAFFIAPKSLHRLPMPYLALCRSVLFLAAAFIVYQANFKNIAFTIAIFTIVTQVASLYFEKN